MTLGFLSGSKNFCKLLCVSCEVVVLHGYDWIHWVTKSCTTIAYRWLFRDSQLSLRTSWSAVNKSPKFSARSTAPPLRLLHGALLMWVLWQISQFRSVGEMSINTVTYPKASRLLDVGSKDTLWEELAWESPRSGTSSSTKFSLNSCSHSGISELARPESADNGWPRSIMVSFFICFWKLLVGLVNWLVIGFTADNGFPRYISSTLKLDTGTGEISLSVRSSLSRVSLSLDVDVVCEEDELEEDVEQCLSCLEGVIEVEVEW